jgi:ornithine cyclodeaminase/alanine dehydrogenase-like protein (mu-crystallin family)
MSVEVIDAQRVKALLPMQECIDVMAQAMAAASNAGVTMPPRTFVPVDEQGSVFALMPAVAGTLEGYGAKLLSLTPSNSAQGLPIIRGQFLLFERHTGAPVAVIDAASLTAIRTAAASGLATRLLARPDARSCGIFGTGVQAATHLEAMCAVRPVERIHVWGRNFDKAVAWAEQQAGLTGRPITASQDPAEVASCDLVCTVTAAREPILEGAWVQPGTHINLVGSHTLTTREADSALIARSKVYVDLMESMRNEAGDLMIPIQEGAVRPDHVRGEIGRVVTGELAGRTGSDEITLYKSLGIAAQDLYAAWHVYRKTPPQGV